ncbi:MAG: hypothetical protein JO205_08465 [Pseudolabrys sp.]|nr:hypothetical protein [Pseudolabrys sp.]MBV9261392.1 hypothetical protein [Pseudolabrys sp.]
MIRLLGVAAALSASALCAAPTFAASIDRTLPMRFELRQQGPADACADHCSSWIAASGAITSETPREFLKFAEGRDLGNATLVLDSDGGSVLGAIALGREVRRLNLSTAVGRIVDVSTDARATLSPRADCESMCTFVLLAGIKRHVPPEARVMVHQIWLGDRREDPTAASYSAEDLVLVQRDIGRLARYSADMGAPSELIELALRIPPWEPMHALTRDELVRMKLDTDEQPIAALPPVATTATSTSATSMPPPAATPVATSGTRAEQISDRRWQMVDRSGSNVLARRHPLTVEGDEIGRFDLIVTCAGPDGYGVSYIERRHEGEARRAAQPVSAVTLRAGGVTASLKVVSSQRSLDAGVLDTLANGTVPAALIKTFTASGPHSLMVFTTGGDLKTAIRLGNTGASQSLPAISGSCQNSVNRAESQAPKTGNLAAN